MLNIKVLSLGPVQTNCYIIWNENNDCIIFDPGEEANKIVEVVKSNQLQPKAVFLTHAHFDHIGAVDAIRSQYNIPLYIHEEEVEWLSDPLKNGSGKYAMLPNYTANPPSEDHVIRKEQQFDIAGMKFEAVFTPGHSPGSISYIFHDDGFAIVGDTLFFQSIGRTDLFGGSLEVLLKSIHEKLLVLPEDILIYPGHGQYTTPMNEMETNPFLNGFSF